MTKTTSNLFTPLTLPNGTIVSNRFFKSAMNEALGDKNGQPTTEHIQLYQTWAQGGAGILMTGNVMVDRQATAEPGNVVFDKETNLTMLKSWANAGKIHHNHIWVQLNHPGKSIPILMKQETVAPSAVGMSGDLRKAFAIPRELTVEEIQEIVQKFVFAAQLAKEAGFTGVQLHAAHGYLINQFLSPADNRRQDQYGGSLENRMRFLVEIYQAVRETVGADFPIGMKLNSSDFTPTGFNEEESLRVIEKMTELGIDLIEISGGNYESQKMMSESRKPVFIDFAKKVKQLRTAPIVLTGGFKTEKVMMEAVQEDVAMVGIARAMVLRPYMVREMADASFEKLELPRLSTGFKQLDSKIGGLAAISYYEQQMERIGKGKNPIVSRNAWKPLFHAVRRYGLTALLPKRG